jgi:hypothetical protein
VSLSMGNHLCFVLFQEDVRSAKMNGLMRQEARLYSSVSNLLFLSHLKH